MHYLKLKELLEKLKLKGQQPLEIGMESRMVNNLSNDTKNLNVWWKISYSLTITRSSLALSLGAFLIEVVWVCNFVCVSSPIELIHNHSCVFLLYCGHFPLIQA